MEQRTQPGSMSLAELAVLSGYSARTVRYYISQGLLHPPLGGGRGSYYDPSHLGRLDQIKAQQAAGLSLLEIASQRQNLPVLPQVVPRTPSDSWEQYELAPDIRVSLRLGVPPRRKCQLLRAIADLERVALQDPSVLDDEEHIK